MMSEWEGLTAVGQQGLETVHMNSPQLTGKGPQAKLEEMKLLMGERNKALRV